jgi:hypothetical protein
MLVWGTSLSTEGEVAHGFLFDRGDVDRGEVAGTGQSGELHGIAAVGFDAVARFFGD